MIVEADESDGTFTKLPTEIGVVTNIDPEHLDYFGTVENMHREYEAFYRNIPFYGLARDVHRPSGRARDDRAAGPARDGRRLLTYGTSERCRPDAARRAQPKAHDDHSMPTSARA